MGAAQLSEQEIARRLPVWSALSEAFLDTELDEHNYQHIAQVIGAHGFTRTDAEAIFQTEVAPAFAYNLWSVAGEWAGWSEAAVRERVLASRNKSFSQGFNRIMLGRQLTDEWARISAYLTD